MKSKLLVATAAIFLASLVATKSASAIPTNFDVVDITPGLDTNNATATGTSNGVGWTLEGAFFSSCCGASTTGTFTGFNTTDFITPVAMTDALHITSRDFVLTFDQTITSIVFYLRENDAGASFDLGLMPTVISGAGNLGIVGTRISPNASGGAVRYSGLNTTMLNHTTNVMNGMNLAFFVEGDAVSVPEPGTLALFGLGLAGLGFARRKKAA